jgi:O-antigen ligase/polysaccharide polymerase Wzy-like membrane protein
MRERWPAVLLCALVVQIPFEIRYTFLGLSNLQWTFLAVATASTPLLLQHRKKLIHDRLVQFAALFVAIQWLAAAYAPEFHANAAKAAARFTAGALLLAISRIINKEKLVVQAWAISSAVAALYALVAYAGFGFPSLFRTEEFYIGQIQRLSGSFEYPNTAAAYFAMSLPIVWRSSLRPALKTIGAFLLWCALSLTFSKGALGAAAIVLLARRRSALALLAIGAVAYAALLPLQPFMSGAAGATYKVEWNRLDQQPGVSDEVPLQIENTGMTKWRAHGWRTVAVGYRWWNPRTEKFLKVTAPVTSLPHDVAPGETIHVPAVVRMPEQPGRYILVLELFSNDLLWFSQTGVTPLLIEANVDGSTPRRVGSADLSSLYNRTQIRGNLTASVSRSSLWMAALSMFLAHPFGVGPDNFRLEYGKYLNASHWDTDVHSNNLYLELLTGSGFLGLAAFGLILAARHWDFEPPSLAAAIFLIHGLVDYFLMSTPIYFGFWILLGTRFPFLQLRELNQPRQGRHIYVQNP